MGIVIDARAKFQERREAAARVRKYNPKKQTPSVKPLQTSDYLMQKLLESFNDDPSLRPLK